MPPTSSLLDGQDANEISLGEVIRVLKRIEVNQTKQEEDTSERYRELSEKMNVIIGPISKHTYQIETLQEVQKAQALIITDHEKRLNAFNVKAAYVAGVVAAIISYIPMLVRWIAGKPVNP